ncbi:flagellar biosynthetic protein FliO [Cellulomonas edaphi]|uniref:Flagellar biosynthetic protein FliO n=1 Tax=Cellulomonas edaphi TaxID=3053468 RepID=A0ABT7S4M5_9CELL|nr:flagellar biosynthetic protein FliO [Cellulomons edaphi]MDM7830558.1 flagellar biosynthetic protein FliO [Cellulomons edaphi]
MDTLMLAARVILSLACVVGLIWYAGRRMNGPRRERTQREAEVRVVGKQSVSRHSGVAVVAVGNRRMLVGYGDQQVTMLTELAPVVETAPLPAAPRTPAAAGDARAKPRLSLPTLPSPRVSAETSVAKASAKAAAASSDGPLQGSVLSPETWRTLVRTLQDRTVRR